MCLLGIGNNKSRRSGYLMNDYKLKKAIDMAVDYCKNNGDTIVQIPFHDWDNTIVSAYWETVNTGEGPCDIIIVKIKRDSIGEEYKLILDTLCKDRMQCIKNFKPRG